VLVCDFSWKSRFTPEDVIDVPPVVSTMDATMLAVLDVPDVGTVGRVACTCKYAPEGAYAEDAALTR